MDDSGRLEATKRIGPDEGIRTPNPQFRRLMLYPLSYVRARTKMIPYRNLKSAQLST